MNRAINAIICVALGIMLSSTQHARSSADPVGITGDPITTYVEDFSSYAHKAYADRAEWDISMHQLRAAATSGGAHRESAIAPDGRGGAYVVWQDLRNNDSNGDWDIYGQHVDAHGNRLWRADLRINSDTGETFQGNPLVFVNHQGDAVVAWVDDREQPTAKAVYAQKLSSQGDKLWPGDVRVNGPRSYRAGWGTDDFGMALDGADNLIVAWEGIWDGDWNDHDVHAQKITPEGRRAWPDDVRVNGQKEFGQWAIAVGADSQGNAVIAWVDGRYGGEDIHAQRLDANGNRQWTSDIKVSAGLARPSQGNPNVVMDSQGNAVIVWRSGPPDPPLDAQTSAILAQKISPTGLLQWGVERQVPLDSTRVFRGHPRAAAAPGDAVMVIWEDTRRGFELGTEDLQSQLLDAHGLRQWATDVRINPPDWRNWNLKPRVQLLGHSAWVSWETDDDIYIQAFDAQSQATLLPLPARVNEGDGKLDEVDPDLVTLRSGQLLIAWHTVERNNWNVRAQLLFPDGTPAWPTSVQVNDTDVEMKRQRLRVAANLRDEALIVWHDEQGGVFGQILDSAGNRLWHTERRLDANGRRSYYPNVAALPDGSFVVVWLEERQPGSGLWDVYAQRITATGNTWWTGGKRINQAEHWLSEVDARSAPEVVVDREAYFVVLWRGQRDAGMDIFMRRFAPAGTPAWPDDRPLGASLYTLSGRFHDRVFAAAADAEITLAISSARDGQYGILVQRYDLNGQPLWNAGTWVSAGTQTAHYGNPNVTRLPDGGVTVVWDEEPGPRDAYAQRLSAAGELLWPAKVRLNDNLAWPLHPSLSGLFEDSLIAVWNDERYADNNIYAQRFGTAGQLSWRTNLGVTGAEHFIQRWGAAESVTVNSGPNSISRVALTAGQTLANGRVDYSLTNDGGRTWEEAAPGGIHTFRSVGSDLRWRAILTGTGNDTPIIERVTLRYGPGLGQDAYEPDDACQPSAPIPHVSTDGSVQKRDFDHAGDADWIAFDVVAGKTYVIQAANTQARADIVLELYDTCGDESLAADSNAFGQDASITWGAAVSGRYYARVQNHDPLIFGAETGYDLSVRLLIKNPIAIIVAGHDDTYKLQSKINYAADMAYRVLVASGVPKNNIRYFSINPQRDVDGNGRNDDIYDSPSPEAVRDAIQQWAKSRGAGAGTPFFLYLADHGNHDQFYAAGTAGKITAADLDLWLANLEATTGIVNVNIIIEACRGGSFIDITELGAAEISRANRVIIAATSSRLNAYASDLGAHFSDAFWTAIGQSRDLRTAFELGREAVAVTGLSQEPWLDDNGDAFADDRDGALASARGVGGAFVSPAPTIDWATLGPVRQGTAALHAQVRDEFRVMRVWAEIYAPDFVEPPPAADGSTPELHLPIVTLAAAGNNRYAATYTGFTRPGLYRVVVYAQDDDGNQALPLAVSVTTDQGGATLYLPLVFR